MTEQPSHPGNLSNRELVRELASDLSVLLKRQLLLAQLEGQAQLEREKRAAGLLGIGSGAAYAALVLFLVAAALGIGAALDALWAGALIVAAATLITALVVGGLGWARRVRRPLPRSQRALIKEMAWAKQRMRT